jgi:hypothetical protein
MGMLPCAGKGIRLPVGALVVQVDTLHHAAVYQQRDFDAMDRA